MAFTKAGKVVTPEWYAGTIVPTMVFDEYRDITVIENKSLHGYKLSQRYFVKHFKHVCVIVHLEYIKNPCTIDFLLNTCILLWPFESEPINREHFFIFLKYYLQVKTIILLHSFFNSSEVRRIDAAWAVAVMLVTVICLHRINLVYFLLY